MQRLFNMSLLVVRQFMIIVFGLLSLSGCGQNNDSTSSTGGNPLIGKWLSSKCSDSGTFSNRSIFEFDASAAYVWDVNYTDVSCSTDVFKFRMMPHTYSSPNSQPVVLTTYQDSQYLVIATSAAGRDQANSEKFCEFDDWKLNVPQDVRNRACKWKFGASTVAMGTKMENPFSSTSISIYFKIIGDKLCISDQAIAIDPPLEACWSKLP